VTSSAHSGARTVAPPGPLRVLVVDDSAVAREVLSTVLRNEGFEVTTAANAAVAAQRIAQQRPNVLMLDLQMPGMSGLEFLEQLMATDPIPVVVCSDIAQPGAASALRALELGAIDVLPKPTVGVRALLDGGSERLADIIRVASSARMRRARHRPPAPMPPARAGKASPEAPSRTVRPAKPWLGRVILIGASTGGTEAIREVLSGLSASAPPVVIVQHMPREYTGTFARRLNEVTPLSVREAVDGDVLAPGLVLVAPGGRQIEVVGSLGAATLRISEGPLVSGHRPSVDALFRSAATVLGDRVSAALLTGMGADGADGLLRLQRAGAETIAQNEATCIVFGMPKEAILLGAADRVLPLDEIAAGLEAAAPAVPTRRR
jgi:two-component system chemotaxis response regulator CheB